MNKTRFNQTRRLVLKGASALAIGAAFMLAPVMAADKELTLFEWSGYEDPEFHKDYTAKHKDSPQYAYFGEEEEAFQKLRAGFKADIAHPCTQSLPKWREAGLIKPIDKSRITAWNDLMPKMRDMAGYQADGQVWAIPADWGNTSIVYRTDKVDEADTKSLHMLTSEKYKGKISMPDNVDDIYALGALAIGMKDWTGMTDEQFKQASDFLRAVHKNVRFYWTDGTQLSQAMANGEVTVSWAWNETPTTMQAEGHPVKAALDTKEGITTWVCGFVMLKNAPGSEDKAYDYINAFLAESSANYMVDAWGYGHSNNAALAKMDKKLLESKGFGDIEGFFKTSLFQSATSPALREKMIAEFEKIKAGF